MRTINWIILTIILSIMVGCKTKNTSNQREKDVFNFQKSDNFQQIIYKGKIAEVIVEKIIYEFPNQPNYYLKFIIKNISNKKIGVDLTNPIKQIYPNFWCFYCSTNEGINEGGRIIQPFNDFNKLKNDFNSSKITVINANEEFHYYRNICQYDDEIINFNDTSEQDFFF